MYPHRIYKYLIATLGVVCLLSILVVQDSFARNPKVSFKKCLSCHPGLKEELSRNDVHEPFKEFKCSSCHNPHAAKHEHLVKDKIDKLCKGCHQRENKLMTKNHKHAPFQQGECLSCHKPHASNNKKLLKAKGQQLCFECHSNKDGSFSKKYKHSPVSKGLCLTCHRPHASDYEALAKKERRNLCVGCHSISDSRTKSAHLGYPMEDTDCMSCHNPHGSSRKGLVREAMHTPFARKRCKSCHNGLQSRDPLGLKSKGAFVCAGCHPKVLETFNKVNSHVTKGIFCVNCHNPHASDEKALRKAKEAKICFNCHEDTKRHVNDEENRYKHPLLEKKECTPCHRPHGSNFKLFFAGDEVKDCTGCHERHAKFTHPIGEKAIDPRSKQEITCITCHNLMGSPNQFALRFDRKKELCVQCHKGY